MKLVDFCFTSEIEIIIGDRTTESTLFFNEITNLKVPTYNFKRESIPEGAYVDKEYIFLENEANPLILKNFAFRKRSILFQPKQLFKRITSWFYVLLQNKFFSEKNSNYLLSRILNLITTYMWSFIEEKDKRFFVKILEVNNFCFKILISLRLAEFKIFIFTLSSSNNCNLVFF